MACRWNIIDTTQNFTYTFNSAAFNDTTYLVELYATSQHDCFDDTSLYNHCISRPYSNYY